MCLAQWEDSVVIKSVCLSLPQYGKLNTEKELNDVGGFEIDWEVMHHIDF